MHSRKKKSMRCLASFSTPSAVIAFQGVEKLGSLHSQKKGCGPVDLGAQPCKFSVSVPRSVLTLISRRHTAPERRPQGRKGSRYPLRPLKLSSCKVLPL